MLSGFIFAILKITKMPREKSEAFLFCERWQVSLNDESFMQIAINKANKAGNETWKNPRVGAVVVKDGEILATGHTHQFGGVHAERDALNKLSLKQSAGATLYVTLEPCNHYGKQPPCTAAIISAGIRRVVIAEKDPHGLVTGKGIKHLQENGIAVITGVLEHEAVKLNPHYDFFYRHQRPWLTLKQAVSLDYRVTEKKGQRTAITGDLANKVVHAERANFQGIMIGSETAIIDNPRLLAIPKPQFMPIRIILDRRGRLINYPELFVLNDQQAPTWVFTENKAMVGQFQENVTVFYQEKWLLQAVMAELAEHGVQSVYVEGGPTLQRALLDQGLAEEVITYINPQLLGTSGVTGIIPRQKIVFVDQRVKILDKDIRIAERKIKNV